MKEKQVLLALNNTLMHGGLVYARLAELVEKVVGVPKTERDAQYLIFEFKRLYMFGSSPVDVSKWPKIGFLDASSVKEDLDTYEWRIIEMSMHLIMDMIQRESGKSIEEWIMTMEQHDDSICEYEEALYQLLEGHVSFYTVFIFHYCNYHLGQNRDRVGGNLLPFTNLLDDKKT